MTHEDEYDVRLTDDGRISITFPKDKFLYIHNSIYEAFKGVFKGNWNIGNEEMGIISTFDSVLERARKLINDNGAKELK